MNIYQFTTDTTLASGASSHNTNRIPGGIANQLLVTTTGSATKFDIRVVDNKDRLIYEDKGVRARFDRTLELAMVGIYTITVTNGTVDDSCSIYLSVQE